MDKPHLTTERTLISLLEFNDVDGIVNFYIENEKHLSSWDPKKPEGFFTREYWLEKVQSAHNEWLEKKALRLIIKQKIDEKIIGFMTFSSFERGPFQACRLGYKIHFENEGKGYMSEALKESIRFVFEDLNIHRIEANYVPSNERSGRVLERIGFKKEGLAENYLHINGEWRDHILTSLTNQYWREQ